MKTRIISAIAALVSLCLLAKFAAAVLEPRSPGWSAGPKSELTNATSFSKFDYRRDEWLGNARTVAAMIRYLLEPETPELNRALVASNGAEKIQLGQDVARPRMPMPVQSNLLASVDGLAPAQFDNDNPFSNRNLIVSIATPASRSTTAVFIFNDTSSGFDGLRSFKIIERLNVVVTNSQPASNAPAKSVARPA